MNGELLIRLVRTLNWAVAASYAILFLPLLLPSLTGRVFAEGDLKGFHLPLRYLYQQALSGGDVLLWTPAIMSGYYIHGEGQAGMFHPVHLLLYGAFPLTVAFNLDLVISYAAACAGMWLWLQRIGLDRGIAAFGGVMVAFSGFNLWHYQHMNVVAVWAHMPWLLYTIDILMRAETPRSLFLGYVAVAGVIASAALLGAPQALWFVVFGAAVFLLFRRRASSRRLALVGCGAITGLLTGGVQLLPTIDVLRQSTRSILGQEFALTFSLHPLNILQLWSPYVFLNYAYIPDDPPFIHEFTVYSGALLSVSVMWPFIRRYPVFHSKEIIAPAVTLVVLGLVLALGRYGAARSILTALPGIGSLRAPARYIALLQFGLVTLAAIALNDLLALHRTATGLSKGRIWPLLVPASFSLLATALLNWRLLHVFLEVPFSPARVAVNGTLIVFSITALVILAAQRIRWALPVLVMATAADLASWGYAEVFRTRPQRISSLVEEVEPPLRPTETVFVTSPRMDGNVLVLAGYRLASGYVGLPPATHFHYSSSISRQLSGAHWEYTAHGKEPYAGAVERARMIAATRVSDRIGLDWDKVDLHTTALLERDIATLQGPPGRAEVVIDRPGHIVVEVDAPGRQLLALTERFHDGWTASRDGVALQTVAVHGDFLGCVVDSGHARVEFTFRPASFTAGLVTSASGLLSCVLAIVMIYRSQPAR